jgi:hypothetical protein
MPYFFWTLVPPPSGTLPPLIMAWPPISLSASTRITEQPASHAAIAAGSLSPPRRSQRHRPRGPSRQGTALSPHPVRLRPTSASSSRSPSHNDMPRAPGCLRPRGSSLRSSQNAGLPPAGKYSPADKALCWTLQSQSTIHARPAQPQLPMWRSSLGALQPRFKGTQALAQAVRPVSVQSADLCSETRQRVVRAVSGHTTTPAEAAQFDPSRSESAHQNVRKADA